MGVSQRFWRDMEFLLRPTMRALMPPSVLPLHGEVTSGGTWSVRVLPVAPPSFDGVVALVIVESPFLALRCERERAVEKIEAALRPEVPVGVELHIAVVSPSMVAAVEAAVILAGAAGAEPLTHAWIMGG